MQFALLLGAAALLGGGTAGWRASVYQSGVLNPALEGRDLRVTGIVAAMPQRTESGLRLRLAVESAATPDGQPVALPALVDVSWYGGAFAVAAMPTADAESAPVPPVGLNRLPAQVQAGERWALTLRLKAPHGGLNPHGFDYELYLWEQGVGATGYVRATAHDPVPARLAQTGRYPLTWVRQAVRDRITAHIANRQVAGLVAALVVGDQAAIERADWDVFRATGVAHLVSISGLHITMFAWGAAALVGWLWRRSARLCQALPAPSAALLGGMTLATVYALFSGWGVPAQRTCWMLATVGILRLAGVRWPWGMVWLLAGAVVVAADPWALLQAGFWLSFVAVGVLFAADPGSAVEAQGTPACGLAARAWHKLLAMAHEQWTITLALAPLTLLLFGQFSVVGLLANALAIPWITLVVTPLAMLGVLLPLAWDVASAAIAVLMAVLQWMAALPGATVALARAPLWMGVLAVLGGVALVLPWSWGLRLWGATWMLPLLLWQAPRVPQGQFELLAPDIGQGNAVLVRTAGHALLYDAGPRYSLESDAGHRVIVPLLQALQVRLDTLVLSHRDTDHVGGAAAVLAQQPQANWIGSLANDSNALLPRPGVRCEAGMHWQWDGVHFEVLHPLAVDYQQARKPNALSCVLRITAGSQVALLVGDIEEPQEAALLARERDLRTRVLLVPHHGSKTSSSTAFLDAVAPHVALVQAGYRNRFGHPAAAVVQRYTMQGVAVVDSPHCGAWTWQSWRTDAPQGQCQRDLARRYWHHQYQQPS